MPRGMVAIASVCMFVVAVATVMVVGPVLSSGAAAAASHSEQTQQPSLRDRRGVNGTNATCPSGYEGDGQTCMGKSKNRERERGIKCVGVCLGAWLRFCACACLCV